MGAETDFNSLQFEKRLATLKDSQESVNSCCVWCLENRQHHKKIVSTWLNVLKRVRIEQRLTLFYLANDVIQYSKRKNYEFVESWGTALQKATTMVRDEKVKHKILRIFRIWEQRNVYGEEFLTDLAGLISASPTNKKTDESHEFQPSYLIQKIRSCARLESDTDLKLTNFKQHNPKLLDGETLVSALKDRAHVDDVEKELNDYVDHMEAYINALKLEIKARNSLITMLLNAETQLEKDRKDVKVVAVAYKSFATRVRNLKRKLDEKKSTLSSPIPSPDINAPSPSPDSDIDLPEETSKGSNCTNVEIFSFTNAGFYNPVTSSTTETTNTFMNNGFSSFMGSNVPFNMRGVNASDIFSNNSNSISSNAVNQTQSSNNNYNSNNIASLFPSIIQPPPPPAPVPPVSRTSYNQYNTSMPLAPPPLPPFTKGDSTSLYGTDSIYNEYTTSQTNVYGNGSYNQQPTPVSDPYQSNNNYTTNYNTETTAYSTTSFESNVPPQTDQSFQYDPYNPDEYNPEEEPETWENEEQWDQPPSVVDTPASPPPLEKEAFIEPLEYHDGQDMLGAEDVDHRVLNVHGNTNIGTINILEKKKDIDHRNLISLTDSPSDSTPTDASWKSSVDQDYRIKNAESEDKDYRTISSDVPNYTSSLIPTQAKKSSEIQPSRKVQDNTESIDMELSDDEINECEATEEQSSNDYSINDGILPPPPFPDDADANQFLNSLSEELNYEENNYGMFSSIQEDDEANWGSNSSENNSMPPITSNRLLGDHPNLPNNWVDSPGNNQPFQSDMRFRGRASRGIRGNFGGNRGEFNNRGDFWGRGRGGFRGGMNLNNKFRGGKPRMRARGRGWPNTNNFNPRGNFRGAGGGNWMSN